eukprot:3768999-Pyramimonas_sp.AAC.1
MLLSHRPHDRAFSRSEDVQGWVRRDSAPGRHSTQPTWSTTGAIPPTPGTLSWPRTRPRNPTKAKQAQTQSDPDYVGARPRLGFPLEGTRPPRSSSPITT